MPRLSAWQGNVEWWKRREFHLSVAERRLVCSGLIEMIVLDFSWCTYLGCLLICATLHDAEPWWRKQVVECFTDLTLAFEEFFVSKWPCREASWRSFRSMTTFVSAEKFCAKWENFQETRASWLWSYIQEVNSCEYSFNSEISAAWSYSNYSFHPSLLLLIKSISLTCFHQRSS